AWRKLSFGSLKLRVWNDAYRRPGGIATKRDRLHFTRTSARVQWRGMTGASEARDGLSDIDHTVQHRHENESAGLLQNSCELAVQLREKATRINGFCGVSFDHCAHHRRDQRRTNAMAHHIANTNSSRVAVKPCDVKEIAAHQCGRQITMTKAEPCCACAGVCWNTRIGARHQRL